MYKFHHHSVGRIVQCKDKLFFEKVLQSVINGVTVYACCINIFSFLSIRSNQDAYDTNKMAEEFTHSFFDQAFSVGQQVKWLLMK